MSHVWGEKKEAEEEVQAKGDNVSMTVVKMM